MDGEGAAKALIDQVGATPGDLITLRSHGRCYEGVLMPHHAFSGLDIITIKLANGYNIGVAVEKGSELAITEKGTMPKAPKKKATLNPKKPTVSILGTGGTIASYVDYRTGAVHPALSAEDMTFAVPGLLNWCNLRATVVYSLLSENMRPAYWRQLAHEAAKALNSGSRGVVIPHGTDTLGYTAAALSFMLPHLTGPVVLVGSQRSSDRPSSDAHLNLRAAVKIAATSDLGEVVVAMHGEMSDRSICIHRGTRVRKMHTSRRDAFRSFGKPLGVIDNDHIQLEGYRKKGKGPVVVDDRLDEHVVLVYFYPGLQPEHLDRILAGCHGAVIAGTGLGHIATDLIPTLKKAGEEGMHVVMTSQCLDGRVNLNVYSTGRDLLRADIIPGEDMLPETAYVKLMWVLGHTKEPAKVRELMRQNIVGEISERRHIDG